MNKHGQRITKGKYIFRHDNVAVYRAKVVETFF